MNDLVIGVLGGMGPEATVNFYSNLTKATKAIIDQDHFHVIIDSNVKIPDRTGHILKGTPSPIEALTKSAKRLQNAGADIVCMPCITAHSFADDIAASIDIPFVHAIKETDIYIKKHFPQITRVGILCTSGSKQMKVYDKVFKDLEIYYPDDHIQTTKVMPAIYGEFGIKAGFTTGEPKTLLTEAAEHLVAKGVQLIVAGCTDIPLAFTPSDTQLPYIDPMQVVIDYLIKYHTL